MKKLLALVLALVMTLGLATVGANAATKYADADSINYDEAVDVMTAIGVLGGDETGFRPADTLKRSEGAKIVAYLMLGNKAAEAIQATGNKFTDVPANHWAAGYIEYLTSVGVIGGKGNGIFDPDGQLTATQFAKMLLVALGYDANIEGFGGSDWSINVQKVANQVGLYSGNSSVVGNNAVTREEAALYAFNAVKSPLVQYENKGSTVSVNGATIDFGASNWTYMTTAARGSRYDNIDDATENKDGTGAQIIEFGEQYYDGLKVVADADDFGRPANKWTYKNTKVGTYVDTADLVKSYTVAVKGSDLYDLLGKEQINAGDLVYYVDGRVNDTIKQSNMIKTNIANYATTGKGVLTEVYKLGDDLVIVSINTYMAKATADYNAKKELLNVDVYLTLDGDVASKTIAADDIPAIANYKKDTPLRVTVAFNGTDYDVITAEVPETTLDAKVTKYNKTDYLVTGGAQKDYAKKVFLAPDENTGDPNPLSIYSQETKSLSDYTYDISYDAYGYVLGVQVHEGESHYVFLAGYNATGSAIGSGSATAFLIFADGTTATARLNVSDTNENIEDANDAGYVAIDDEASEYNRWFTYSEDNGVYTLKPVARHLEVETEDFNIDEANEVKIDPTKARVKDSDENVYAYGNDNSVFITVDAKTVAGDTGRSISKVTGVYTGIQSVKLRAFDTYDAQGDSDQKSITTEDSLFVIYNSDNYIVAAVLVGENEGTSNYVYAVKGTRNEYLGSDGKYYWDFEAIVDGEHKTLTVKDTYNKSLANEMKIDAITDYSHGGYTSEALFELSYDSDGYVIGAKQITDGDVASTDKVYGDAEFEAEAAISAGTVTQTAYQLTDDSLTDVALTATGRTLYVGDQASVGLTVAANAPIWVVQKYKTTNPSIEEYTTFAQALAALNDKDEFTGCIAAALNDNGTAKWVVIKSDDAVGFVGDDGTTVTASFDAITFDVGDASQFVLSKNGTALTEGTELEDVYFEVATRSETQNDYRTVASGTADITVGADGAVELKTLLGADPAEGTAYRVYMDGVTSNAVTQVAAANP